MSGKRGFDIDQPRWDQTTYWGRLRHFAAITSPTNLLFSSESLEAAKILVQGYREGNPWATNQSEDVVWRAKTLLDSTLHPDTGDVIFLPFRLSSFVPTNLLIVAGMLVPNPTTASILFWQITNQSVNVAFNYCNANKTTVMSSTETAIAYATAVGSSCTIALGLKAMVSRIQNVNPFTKSLLSRIVPFGAVAGAGMINVFAMRGKELVEGIEVQDVQGLPLGKSTAAGYSAVSQVAISRVATAFPVIILPGLIMSAVEKMACYKRYPRLHIPTNMAAIAGSLMVALPAATALFPQRASLPVAALEPEIRSSLPAHVERVYFNRGL